jgi:chromosome partitioning protein
MILVAGGIKGGVGKSTLAANLAVLSAYSGRDVVLVDTDTQQTTMQWAAARAESRRAHHDVTTIALGGEHIRLELQRLAQRYSTVIVDAGARDSRTQRSALSVAHTVLLPFPPRGPDLWTLDSVVETLGEIREHNPRLRALAFVNKADPAGGDNEEAETAFTEHAGALDLIPVRVGTRKAIAVAHLAGLAAFEAARVDHKAVDELNALYRCCLGTEAISPMHRVSVEKVLKR